MGERVNKLYRPANLVEALEAVKNAGYTDDEARDIIKKLYAAGWRVVYVGKTE